MPARNLSLSRKRPAPAVPPPAATAAPAPDAADLLTLRGDAAEITCREAAEVGQRTVNQIAKFGEFRGHAQGPFKLDAKAFADIVRNFRATKNRRVPVDYEHTSEAMPDSVAQHGVPALAWITDLDDRGDGTLWATFEWVDPAAVEHVRAKRYLYLSPAIQFGARDKETGAPIGARLTSVALTNKPFLDGMAPVTASEATTTASLTPGDVHIPALQGATRSPNAMNDEMQPGAAPAVAADLPKMQPAAAPSAAAVVADAAKEKAEKEAASADDAKRDGYGKFATMRRMAVACGMGDYDAAAEGAEDALIAHIAATVAELARYQKAEKDAMASAAAAMSDRVIAAGCAPAAAREKLTALYLSDRETFEALYPAERLDAKPAAATPEALRDAARPGAPSPAAKALLSEQVAVSEPHPTPPAHGESVAEISAAREALAKRLLSEGKAKSHAEAALLADRTISQQRAARLVAPFTGA